MQGVRVSLADIQEAPKNSLILLSGPPGAGKSTFCHQVVLNNLAADRPIIFVTTEHGPAEVIGPLREKGLRELAPGALSFVDAFGETVGVSTPERPDTTGANCEDLNSISMAIAKLQERIGRRDVFLAFDSLTSPYLFNDKEVIRFMRLCLAKFASEGNSVLALMDEGCGKEEDLGAMMSVADGILRMDMKENLKIINVLKYPKLEPVRIEVPIQPKPTVKSSFVSLTESALRVDSRLKRAWRQSVMGQNEAAVRKEVGDFVNLFWPQFARWSTVLWDPKGFPTMIYEVNKEDALFLVSKEVRRSVPWRFRLLLNLVSLLQTLAVFPKDFSKVKDMKKVPRMGGAHRSLANRERSGIIEYLEGASKTDEHYFRVHESSDCWGLENVGTSIASYLPPHMIGQLVGIEKDGRDWNAIETKCIGLGDPYCEFKLVPGEIDGLKDSLEKDASVVERIHERLIERLLGFLLHEKPLVDRPGFGSDVHLHPVMHCFGFPYLALGGDRYRMALRMGGAKSGSQVGKRLIGAGVREEEAIGLVIDFLNYCKVGKVTFGETVRIRDNCENVAMGLSGFFPPSMQPSCYFTTGFLNGLFSAVKGRHVREVKCIGAGDPYCEWEMI
jgi:KaiC/GvpD/RAD55 family RecA-like ATPase/predicted hydrocarbon binding protein